MADIINGLLKSAIYLHVVDYSIVKSAGDPIDAFTAFNTDLEIPAVADASECYRLEDMDFTIQKYKQHVKTAKNILHIRPISQCV